MASSVIGLLVTELSVWPVRSIGLWLLLPYGGYTGHRKTGKETVVDDNPQGQQDGRRMRLSHRS